MRVFVLFAVALTLLGGGTANAAGGKINPDYHHVSVVAGAMSQRTVESITCRRNKESILSGGIDLEGGYGTMTASGYYPLDVDADPGYDNYRAIGENLTGGPIFMGATNVCGTVKNVVPRGDSQASRPLRRKTLKAPCASNEHVTGGGGDWDAPYGEGRMSESAPYDDGDDGSVPDDGWLVSFDNFSLTTYTVTAYAHCARNLGGLNYVKERSKATASSRLSESVKCPKGQKVIGGGLEANSNGFAALITSRHSITSNDDRVWDTAVDNDDTIDIPITSHAICHR